MKISFMGAARGVSGSMHIVEANGSRILLDCGLFQGRRQESFDRNRNLPFEAEQVTCCVLSHAHIDHSGNLPNLVRSGFQGDVHATDATCDLCNAMLRDSARIQESDVAHINRRRRERGEPLVEPIYTLADAEASLQRFVSSDYDHWKEIAPGVRLMFRDAGHILGSAVVVLEISEAGKTMRLLYTGDLGRSNMPILRDPTIVPDVDYLIIESTYGDRMHDTPEHAESRLRDIINQTFGRNGKVIIPAFAVGRTQEIVYALQRLSAARQIPRLPIYVDSPLAVDVTEIFRRHPECYNDDVKAYMAKHDDPDPFGFAGLRYVRSVGDSKELNYVRQPIVIISAAGMMEAGRVLHHLRNNIESRRNTVLVVSFQAEHTLGRKLVDGEKRVKILGKTYKVRARVQVIDGYSAHADRAGLLSYVNQMDRSRLKGVFVVHGEERQATSLADGIRGLGIAPVHVPQLYETVEVSQAEMVQQR